MARKFYSSHSKYSTIAIENFKNIENGHNSIVDIPVIAIENGHKMLLFHGFFFESPWIAAWPLPRSGRRVPPGQSARPGTDPWMDKTIKHRKTVEKHRTTMEKHRKTLEKT